MWILGGGGGGGCVCVDVGGGCVCVDVGGGGGGRCVLCGRGKESD